MSNKLTKILLTLSVVMIFMAFGITAFAEAAAGSCIGIEDCRAVLCSGNNCRAWQDPGACNGYCHCENPDVNQGVGVCEDQ